VEQLARSSHNSSSFTCTDRSKSWERSTARTALFFAARAAANRPDRAESSEHIASSLPRRAAADRTGKRPLPPCKQARRADATASETSCSMRAVSAAPSDPRPAARSACACGWGAAPAPC